MKSGWMSRPCEICGDIVYSFCDKYKVIDDPVVVGKKVIAHIKCVTLKKYASLALKSDQRDIKSETQLRFKTLDAYKKLTDLTQSREASRKAQLVKKRKIKIVKKAQIRTKELAGGASS